MARASWYFLLDIYICVRLFATHIDYIAECVRTSASNSRTCEWVSEYVHVPKQCIHTSSVCFRAATSNCIWIDTSRCLNLLCVDRSSNRFQSSACSYLFHYFFLNLFFTNLNKNARLFSACFLRDGSPVLAATWCLSSFSLRRNKIILFEFQLCIFRAVLFLLSSKVHDTVLHSGDYGDYLRGVSAEPSVVRLVDVETGEFVRLSIVNKTSCQYVYTLTSTRSNENDSRVWREAAKNFCDSFRCFTFVLRIQITTCCI